MGQRFVFLALLALAASACIPPRPVDPFAGLDLAVPDKTRAQTQARRYQSDVDKPAYQLSEMRYAYAIVVGIQDYEGLPSADFAERDARAVRAHLLALGYPERNVVLLTGRSAGRAAIEKYVESWLPSQVTESSRVFFYYSGHGAPDMKTGDAYLVPWDGDPRYLDHTAYPVRRLYQSLDSLKANKVVVALDACFSGAGGRSVLPKGARPLVVKVENQGATIGRLAVLTAAAGDEIAGADESQGHGLFTYYFLKGLANDPGRPALERLYRYLKPHVQDAARKDNRDQTPQLLPAGSPETAAAVLRD